MPRAPCPERTHSNARYRTRTHKLLLRLLLPDQVSRALDDNRQLFIDVSARLREDAMVRSRTRAAARVAERRQRDREKQVVWAVAFFRLVFDSCVLRFYLCFFAPRYLSSND